MAMMPSSVATDVLEPGLGRVELGGGRRKPDAVVVPMKRAANVSNSRRRSASGRSISAARPRPPADRTRSARPGVSGASFVDAAGRRMDALQQRIEGEARPCGTTISPSRTNASASSCEHRLHQVRKVTGERPAGFRLQLDLFAFPEHQAAEAVPFRLILPALTDGNLVTDTASIGGNGGCNGRVTVPRQLPGRSFSCCATCC